MTGGKPYSRAQLANELGRAAKAAGLTHAARYPIECPRTWQLPVNLRVGAG